MNQHDLTCTDWTSRRRIWQRTHFTLGGMLIIAFIIASLSNPYFLTPYNLEIALTTFFVETLHVQ